MRPKISQNRRLKEKRYIPQNDSRWDMLRTTFSAVTVRVKQKTIVYNFEQKLNISQEIEKPIPNWPRKKTKMATSRGDHAMKKFF